jgi:hypothetical protein
MRVTRIDWLDDCEVCGCGEMYVSTDADEGRLNCGDDVTCPGCGATGEIDCDDGMAFVLWDKGE